MTQLRTSCTLTGNNPESQIDERAQYFLKVLIERYIQDLSLIHI